MYLSSFSLYQKKKKKKDLDELVAEEERKEIEDKENGMYLT